MSTWTTKFRTTALTLTIAAAVAASLPAHAQEKQRASRQENVGVASGFAVGAVAGGPIGAVIGAATGAILGERYHRQAEKNNALTMDLDQTKQQSSKLARNVNDLHSSLVDSQSEREKLTKTYESTRDLETDVGFRTADSDLTADGLEKVHKMGLLAKTLPDAKVRVSGFADPRGSKDFNVALAERRAESVAMALMQAGVPQERLIIESHGADDSTTKDGDLDGYAFDRRVNVRIEHDDAGSQVASTK
jgi:outer membrane protein OmpA-like peptidoglycan-associated protein